jgi:hypothetical protein
VGSAGGPRHPELKGVGSLTYISRLPPSPSGVALYASTFLSVLETLAPTRVVPLPAVPNDSQRLAVAARTFVRAIKSSGAAPDHVVVVELAGRGLAEFWTALLLSGAPWKRRVWVTIHDSPSVCGGAFFFKSLDRRGGRRVANRLSELLGRRAERALLQRAERVYCLSALGAKQITERFALTRSVQPLPFAAVVTETSVSERRSVFLPGYLDGVENVTPVVLALADGSNGWRLEIGACGEQTGIHVRSLARELGVQNRVELLGYLDEQALNDAFERAAVVVRWKASGWAKGGEPQHGAVSGPLINAMAHGCAIITNDTRGISECLGDAGAIQVDGGASGANELQAVLTTLLLDATQRKRMAATGRDHVVREHDVATVARMLAEG